MKLGIFVCENAVQVMIVAETGCCKSLFRMIHTPIGRFEGRNITTMSNRTKFFTDYEISKEQGKIIYGYEVTKEYQRRLNLLMVECKDVADINEYRNKTTALCLEFEKKYSF